MFQVANEVLFPFYARLRESSTHGSNDELRDGYVRTVRSAAAVALPAGLGMAALAVPLVLVLYGLGVATVRGTARLRRGVGRARVARDAPWRRVQGDRPLVAADLDRRPADRRAPPGHLDRRGPWHRGGRSRAGGREGDIAGHPRRVRRPRAPHPVVHHVHGRGAASRSLRRHGRFGLRVGAAPRAHCSRSSLAIPLGAGVYALFLRLFTPDLYPDPRRAALARVRGQRVRPAPTENAAPDKRRCRNRDTACSTSTPVRSPMRSHDARYRFVTDWSTIRSSRPTRSPRSPTVSRIPRYVANVATSRFSTAATKMPEAVRRPKRCARSLRTLRASRCGRSRVMPSTGR